MRAYEIDDFPPKTRSDSQNDKHCSERSHFFLVEKGDGANNELINIGGSMQNELAQLGEVFQKRREERKISLKEAENATSIRIGYLDAIEQGHLGRLISPVYAQGFIKKYATYLELDGDALIQSFPHVCQILNEKVPEADFAFGIGSLEVRGSPGGEVKWLPNMLWVGLSVVAILSAWFLARYLGLF